MAILAILMSIGGARGTVAIAVYLLMGLVGLPVFAGFKGGPSAFIGPTGGFLIGFIIAGLVYFMLEKLIFSRLKSDYKHRILWGILNSLAFEIVLYTVGVIWFIVVYGRQTGPYRTCGCNRNVRGSVHYSGYCKTCNRRNDRRACRQTCQKMTDFISWN